MKHYRDGEFQIVGSKSNYVFDIFGNSTRNHARLITYRRKPKSQNANQRFTFTFMKTFPKPKPSTKIVPKHIARKVGYQIAELNELFDNGIYCIKNVKSKKLMGVRANSKKVVQN
jgi:hypothetical protein